MDQEARMRHPAAMRTVVALLCVAVLAGCDGSGEEDPMKTHEQFEKLMQRPDLEQAKERYEKLQREIRAKLKDEFDLSEWKKGGGVDQPDSYCSDFPDADGFDVGTYRWAGRVAEGSVIPDWDRAVNLVRQIAAGYGFDKVTLDAGNAEDRTLELVDHSGAKLLLGSRGNTVLRISTGCHLTPEAKRRGEPVTTEESRTIREEKRESRLNDIDG